MTFVHQRALCKFAAGNHKHNNQLVWAESGRVLGKSVYPMFESPNICSSFGLKRPISVRFYLQVSLWLSSFRFGFNTKVKSLWKKCIYRGDQWSNSQFQLFGKSMVFILSRLTVGLWFLLLLWFVAVSNGAHANIIIYNLLRFFLAMVVLAAHPSRFNSNRMYCSKTVMLSSG